MLEKLMQNANFYGLAKVATLPTEKLENQISDFAELNNDKSLSINAKIRNSHLTCKVANKCLNVRERVEVVEWNRRWSPPFPCCPVNRPCL